MNQEEFRRLADRLYDRIDAPLLEGLNGGLSILDGARRDPREPAGTYILGEYHTQEPGLGRLILIYYGSFLEVLGNSPPKAWEDLLWSTMLHELRHHREAMAGRSDLADEEADQVRRSRRRD